MTALSASGLILNVIGAILLYRSIKPSSGSALLRADLKKIRDAQQHGKPFDAEPELQPVAVLEERLAKTGLGCIIAGFTIQFLAVFL